MLQRFWKHKSNPRRMPEPSQEVIVAALTAGIAEDALIDEQLQSVTTEEMVSGSTADKDALKAG